MLRNLEDAWGWIKQLNDKVSRIYSGAFLENSSITEGRMRFIGGLLLIDSGGTLQVIGTLDGEGNFRWVGPWEFDSDEGGRIAGDVDLAGDFDLTGKLTAGDVRIEDGKIYVGVGANQIIIDGVTGEVRSGEVSIRDNKIYIGDMVLDPSNHDGMITMPNDGQVLASGSNLELYGPNGTGGRNGVVIMPDQIMLAKIPEKETLEGLYWLGADLSGRIWKVAQNTGGPIGSPLEWPFPASSATSEYGPRDGRLHAGIDFGQAEGTPIPAAASGTVIESVTLHEGWGNYVKISHSGGIETLYAHMVNPPPVTVGQTVSRGEIIGNVGNTGNSFGAHLHFEVYVDGSTVNPRSKLPTP